MLGKFKRSLKERCPECKTMLQLRTKEIKSMIKGQQVYVYEEYIVCPNCDYSAEIEQKRKRHQEDIFAL